jgi:hypothetical protein
VTEEQMRRDWERQNPLRPGRLVGRASNGWNVFDTNEREGWFNRTARAALVAGEQPYRGPAKDVVAHAVTTQFASPDECFDGPTVGRRHVWDGTLKHEPNEHVYRCGKCGAVQRMVWRDQPSAWKVAAGVR